MLRELSARRPGLCEPELASALEALATSLMHAGQAESALAATMEGVALRRRLAAASADTHAPALAGSLQKLALRLLEQKRSVEARAVMQESVALSRQLALSAPRHRALLAGSLQGLGVSLRAAGEPGLAVDALRECTACYRLLTAAEPHVYKHFLAASLLELAGLQCERHQRGEALVAAEEAVALYISLAAANASYERLLTKSLQVRGECQGLSA
jgi:hypothetical protein